MEGSKVFNIETKFSDNQIPNAKCYELNEAEERRNALERLGYDLSDYDLWKAWLILEESSAERLIREYLIPWFIPELQGRLRTIAANGVNDTEARFIDFKRLFTYLHLSEVYKDKAWIIVDGDDPGKDVIKKIQSNYKTWQAENFKNFSRTNFEEYFPERFQSTVQQIFKSLENNKDDKRKKKKELLEEVLNWIKEDTSTAKNEFETSAKEVIEILKDIERRIESF